MARCGESPEDSRLKQRQKALAVSVTLPVRTDTRIFRMEASARGIHRRTHFSVDDKLRSRFTKRVLQKNPQECWPWVGAVRNGYGTIKHERHLLATHVVAWVNEHGCNVGEGKLVCHTCDNRLCCNPSHLYEGTYADNAHDADRRRNIPRPRGMEIHNSVLTDEIVRLMLALRVCNGWGQRKIGNALGFNERTIENVIRREGWLHIDIPSCEEAAQIIYDWKLRNT